jgi:hypothetical protein
MKSAVSAIAILILFSTHSFAEDLKRLSLDTAAGASPVVETDTEVKTEGAGSVKITTRWPATVFLGEVDGLDGENAGLVYKADVKTDLEGAAYLEMWAHVDGNRYFSKGLNDPVKGRSDWKTVATPFFLQKGQKPDKVTLNLVIEGAGTVWIDNIVLSKEPLQQSK